MNGVPTSTLKNQRTQHGERHVLDGHQRQDTGACEVTDDHDPPPGDEVGEHRQDRAAHDRRQVREGVRDSGLQRRVRVVVDEYGKSDLGELVADIGQRLGQPEGTELTDTEHFAISGLAIQRPSMSSPRALLYCGRDPGRFP